MQMHTTKVVQALLAASLLFASGLTAQGEATGPEAFSAVQEEFEAANSDWMTSYREASKNGAGSEALSKLMAKRPNAKDYVARVRAIVRADASGDDAGAAAGGGHVVVDGDEGRAGELELGLAERAMTEISRRVRVHAKGDGHGDARRRDARWGSPAGMRRRRSPSLSSVFAVRRRGVRARVRELVH